MLGITVKHKIWQLQSDNAATRAAAVTALSQKRDPAAVEGLGKVLLRDDERPLRMAAAQALGLIGHKSAVPTLISALQSEKSWEVRHEIVEALRKIGDPAAVNQLIIMLERNDDATTRECIAFALKSVGGDRLTPTQQAQVAITQDDWTTVQRLGSAAIEPLHDALRSGTPRVRRFSAEALAALPEERALNLLYGCIDTQDLELRIIAARALEEKAWARLTPDRLARVAIILGKWPAVISAGEAAIPPLQEILPSADRETRQHIVAALAEIGGKQATGILLQMMRDDDVAIRRTAAQALAQTHDRAATDALVGALADEDHEVRKAAAAGLLSAGWQPPNPAARARLLIALGDGAALAELGLVAVEELMADLSTPGLSTTAVELLAMMGKIAVDPLLEALASAAAELRAGVIEALAALGDARAVPRLIELFGKADPDACRRASWALEQLGWQPANSAERAAILIACEDWEGVSACGPAAVEPLLARLGKKQGVESVLAALEPLVQGAHVRQLSVQQLQEIGRITEASARPSSGGARILVAGPALRQAVVARRVAQLARMELQRRQRGSL